MSNMQEGNLMGGVFNIQRYSTHDGPGIRTTVFLKGCPLSCFWCQNPESQSIHPELMVRKDACTSCLRCVQACSVGAISVVEKEVSVNRALCNACGACVAVCPENNRKVEGKNMTVKQVMDEVMKDYRIYVNSGGGMTVSGGDCELQPDFTEELLKEAHKQGISTAVEITGAFPWSTVKKIVDHADFVLYDLKCMDEMRHKKGTGVPNSLVLENARNVVNENKKVVFRVPLIPGFNDSREDIEATARFVREDLGLDPVKHLELLAYNNMGEDKYTRLDLDGKRPCYQRQSQEYLEELNAVRMSV